MTATAHLVTVGAMPSAGADGAEVAEALAAEGITLASRVFIEDDEAALERLNAALMDRVIRSGEAFLSHTKLDGRYVIRIAIGNIRTTEAHVARAWALLQEAASA